MLESRKETHAPTTSADATGMSYSSTIPSRGSFDISQYIAFEPTFRETEVDSCFSAFEHIALALQCTPEVWPLLLQCKIHGKAQEVRAMGH